MSGATYKGIENKQFESVSGSVNQPEITLPRDELTLSADKMKSADFENPHDQQPSSAAGDLSGDAVFRIEEYNTYQDRFSQVSEAMCERMPSELPWVVVLTSPTEPIQQNLAFNSILTRLSNENQELRVISVQAIGLDDSKGQCSLGLGHVLSEENQLADVVIPTTIANLDYLGYSNCSSILATNFKNRFEKVLAELKQHYDLIVVNSKHSSSFETKAVAESADATYLLLSLQDVEQESAIEAAQELRECGAKLVGCILTDAE
jgi:hypothetical protein